MAVALALPESDVGGAVTSIVGGIALVTAVWASRVTSRVLRLITAAVAVIVTGAVVSVFLGGSGSTTASSIVALCFVVGIPLAIVFGLRDERSVNMQTVFGAVSLYLLLGLVFAFLIEVIVHLSDTTYFAQGTDGTSSERVYFSYVTLATVGYGDLTPATNLGRALAVFEAIFGSLFLITVVGVVVSRLKSGPSRDDLKQLVREAVREERASDGSESR